MALRRKSGRPRPWASLIAALGDPDTQLRWLAALTSGEHRRGGGDRDARAFIEAGGDGGGAGRGREGTGEVDGAGWMSASQMNRRDGDISRAAPDLELPGRLSSQDRSHRGAPPLISRSSRRANAPTVCEHERRPGRLAPSSGAAARPSKAWRSSLSRTYSLKLMSARLIAQASAACCGHRFPQLWFMAVWTKEDDEQRARYIGQAVLGVHCFVPRAWVSYLKSVQVGAHAGLAPPQRSLPDGDRVRLRAQEWTVAPDSGSSWVHTAIRFTPSEPIDRSRVR